MLDECMKDTPPLHFEHVIKKIPFDSKTCLCDCNHNFMILFSGYPVHKIPRDGRHLLFLCSGDDLNTDSLGSAQKLENLMRVNGWKRFLVI